MPCLSNSLAGKAYFVIQPHGYRLVIVEYDLKLIKKLRIQLELEEKLEEIKMKLGLIRELLCTSFGVI